ncbi:MAG TPA: PDZ domain-containing protein [Clostridiales bacterium]|nr:PDZ domain-containing protein [Clostridiales bacterium]
MREFYEFDEERYQRRNTVKSYIIVALIFALIGGLAVYAISPYLPGANGSQDRQVMDNKSGLSNNSKDTTAADKENRVVLGSTADLIIRPDNPVADIVEQVEKAVVGITNRSEVVIPDFFFFNESRSQEVEGYGSGIIISKEGHILTNHHVIDGAKQLFVILYDGEKVEAELIGSDPQSDVAVLKIKHDDLTVAKIGDSDKVRKGDFAIAIGNPLGHELAGTVNFGVISAVNRTLQLDGRKMTLLQTDAAINRGNSGGALFNMKGEVIGMNTIKFGGDLVEGLGFAIPSNVFKPIAQEIIETGKVSYPQKPWLGVYITEINKEASEEFGYPVGILITDVTKDSPALEAGIKPGDVITGINGKKIEKIDELKSTLESFEVGDVIDVSLWRNGNDFVLKVKLGGIDVYD